jgi:phospholipid transport system substrate-binding protein
MHRLIVLVFAALSFALPAFADTPKPAAPAAPAATGPGTTVVKQANDTISALLKQNITPGSPEEKELGNKVIASVRDFLDVDELGKAALAEHWATLSKPQQADFQKTLRSLIETNYVNGMRSNLNYTVDYVGESEKDGKITVQTKVNTQRKGRPYTISIDYVLQKQNGKLRASDVRTDGVSLVENYRASWNKIIAKDGFDGLLKRMREKQQQLEQKKT